jgi:hypothetical protein
MNNTRALDWHIARRTVALTAIALLAGSGAQAWARGVAPGAASPTSLALPGSSSLSTGQSRGPAFVTGNIGSMDTIALPGSGEQGFLMNNGNGSSTLFAPDAVPQTSIA